MLLQKYNELDSYEKLIIQFISVSYEPPQTTLLVNCLYKLNITGPRGNSPTNTNINNLLDKFHKLGLLNDQLQIVPSLVEVISRKAVEQGNFDSFATILQQEAPASFYYGKWTTRCWRAMREARIGIYTQQFDLINDAIDFLSGQCKEATSKLPPIVQITTNPFDPDWFKSLPPSFQFFILNKIFQHAQHSLTSFDDVLLFLETDDTMNQLTADEKVPFDRLLFNQFLLQGSIEKAADLLSSRPESFLGTGAHGSILFLQGRTTESITAFNKDLDHFKQLSKLDKVALFGPAGLFYVLANIKADESTDNKEIAEQISIALSSFEGSPEEESYHYLSLLIKAMDNHLVDDFSELTLDQNSHSLTILFAGLCQFWLNASLDADIEKKIDDMLRLAIDQHYDFFALNFAELLSKTHSSSANYTEIATDIKSRSGLSSLIDIIRTEESWKRSLQALISATSTTPQINLKTRLVWLIEYNQYENTFSINAKEQKLSESNNWSKGRPISLSRLYAGKKLSYLTAQDRKICAAIIKKQNKENRNTSYFFDSNKALVALVGHPLIFLNKSPTTPVELVTGEPKLLVEELGDKLHIHFDQNLIDGDITVYQETPTRFKIIQIGDKHHKIVKIIGLEGLVIPVEAKEQVLTAIGNISSFMTVHSAIAVNDSSNKRNIQVVEADSTIYMHLLPYGTGFRLEMFVKPFAQDLHYMKPGQGAENIMAEVQGVRLQTRRNLALEEQQAQEVEESCPILDLAMDLEQGNEREWHIPDPDDCLQILSELQAISDRIVIEWPEGEKISISQSASISNLNLKIRTNKQNWFSLSGALQLDQDKVINLRELITKAQKSKTRFIQLEEGQFLELTLELKKRLEEISIYANESAEDDEEITLHPLAAMPLEELTNKTNASVDARWNDQIAKIHNSQTYKPILPTTLQADLRDYQREGFNWLARLDFWGVGGCLADDMGLGKTIQSLAIALHKAPNGPSLVIAPTSVSNNWLNEAAKFAPTLTIKSLVGKNRKETIDGLEKFDVLITTYTLLQQEADLLSSVDWQIVILDEAQAIKNAATKRSKAAMMLKCDFRLITTGTPIENHLGELWNLFQFINPGLLGSIAQFNKRFAIPIERYNDRDARLKLKKLIRPFMLRRIKSEVLEELPPRTEVTVHVEMEEDEMIFYESLRQNALEIIEGRTDAQGRHLQILTEIMKLRQACCNTSLVDENININSSKLKVFADIVDELIGSNHKALVFSQFIGHLKILKNHLDAKGIKYKYLDGSTNATKRRKIVDEFQSGEGEIFLISLKAGGLGLNLTAADYVLHMDPWWNPAIEDQASDRAHRIGQTRPVTVYRLVCKNTIEEKIVKLHKEKRDLAGSLLEGSDLSAKLNAEDLLNLIRDI